RSRRTRASGAPKKHPLIQHHLAHETVGKSLGYSYSRIAAGCRQNRRVGGKVHGLVLRAASDDLSASFVSTFDHHFQNFSNVLLITGPLDFPLTFLKNAQALRFFLVGDAI